MALTTILGIMLLVWVAYDLYAGEVWLHRSFKRKTEPVGYWLTISGWFLVALSSLFWSGFA
ncbi:hypothetical protein ABVF61_10645 [Roseibium sp. HPY-6]|uniref:hypothetical protein n=1 Tax=Roseibium sp. HPY-6 TaxID=3229852 RepID=UPI00338F5784